MYAGELVETASASDLYYRPAHPYTYGLLQSIPRPDKKQEKLLPIAGYPPSIFTKIPGCRFWPRLFLCNADLPQFPSGTYAANFQPLPIDVSARHSNAPHIN